MGFDYINIQKKMVGGQKTTRKVAIKNNKGYKSICTYKNGKKCLNKKKKLSHNEITKIKNGIFIPGLFKDITRKHRK
jgi:hypothetical protein